jgi:hypothetical protein
MNNKGFKPEPHISKGEAARLERICDAVLSGDNDAPERFVAWSNRITQRLGGEKAWTQWFVHHANDDLGYAIASKFHDALYQCLPRDVQREMSGKSKECLTSIFLDDGLTLGKDFSMAPDGGFILGEKSIEKLKADMPPQAWADWESQGLIKSFSSCTWEAVEKRLGFPFRQNLLHRLSKLVQQGRAAAVIAGWMLTISCGVSNQVMGNDEDQTLFRLMLGHLKQNHSPVSEQVWNAIQSGHCADGDELLKMDINCLCDVAIAAGSSEENGEIKGDHINRKCMERLALVWRGDRFSMTEIIGYLDKYTNNKAA